MRGHSFIFKLTHNTKKFLQPVPQYAVLNKTDIPYFTAERSIYVNRGAVTSDHKSHCKLIALHKTVGSAAITGIPFCDK